MKPSFPEAFPNSVKDFFNVYMCVCTCTDARKERTLDLLYLKLQVVVSHHTNIGNKIQIPSKEQLVFLIAEPSFQALS